MSVVHSPSEVTREEPYMDYGPMASPDDPPGTFEGAAELPDGHAEPPCRRWSAG